MSYYHDPYLKYPIYEPFQIARTDIEKNILQLQERLRKRREVDLFQQSLSLERLRDYENQIRLKYGIAEELEYKRRTDYARLKQIQLTKIQHNYAMKLQKTRNTQAMLERKIYQDRLRQQEIQRIRSQLYINQIDESLIKRHQDETKSYLYNKQLEKYNQRKKISQNHQFNSNNWIKNAHIQYNQLQDENIQERKTNNKQFSYTLSNKKQIPNKQTIQKTQFYLDKNNNHNVNQPKKETSKKKIRFDIAKNQDQLIKNSNLTATFAPQIKRYIDSNEQILKDYQESKKQRNQSPTKSYLSPYNKSNKKVSRSTTAKAQKKKQLKNQSILYEDKDRIQLNAMKKIQNRLKLSEIVYKDSIFRNIKHQINHLFNTYENQIKVRNDIKEKINTNPQILKKYKMVVE